MIFFVLGIPLFLALCALVINKNRPLGIINALGYALVLLFSANIFYGACILKQTLYIKRFFYVDALSAFFLLTIAVVNFAAALYSIGYIKKDVEEERISEAKVKAYYFLFNLFSLAMYMVVLVGNMGLLWVCIEMTTLVSAFLVGFYRSKESVEAAWKYIIICSVGITFALLGIILFAYAMSLSGAPKGLNWLDLFSAARGLNGKIVKIAFIFVLVGFGTKAGFAPMHTWLPDAHSQAISPISALLSGVLLKTSVYAILRFAIITNAALGSAGFSSNLLILFGLLSLFIAGFFMLVQKDLKRLLAYSSIEHIGVISLGFGIGGVVGLGGALLHVFNHAVTKSLLFFGAGNIIRHYKSHNMPVIQGVLKTMPFSGVFFLLGAFALIGLPPFSIFMSEFMIIISVFSRQLYWAASLVLFLLSVAFGAIVFYFGKMLFGNRPKDILKISEPLSTKMAFVLLFIPICFLGITAPHWLRTAITSVIDVLTGRPGGL